MKSKIIEFLAPSWKITPHMWALAPPWHAPPWHAALPWHAAPAYVFCSTWLAALPAHAVPFWACCCSLGLSSPCGRSPVRPICFKAVTFAHHHFNFQKRVKVWGGACCSPLACCSPWACCAVPFWTCCCPPGLAAPPVKGVQLGKFASKH
jgi:hypothetical protein